MICITITAEAYTAIKATLPPDTQTWPTDPGDHGDVIVWLDRTTIERFGERGLGDDYSDVVLRLAKDERV